MYLTEQTHFILINTAVYTVTFHWRCVRLATTQNEFIRFESIFVCFTHVTAVIVCWVLSTAKSGVTYSHCDLLTYNIIMNMYCAISEVDR